MKTSDSQQMRVLEGLLCKRYGMHTKSVRNDKKPKFRVIKGRIPVHAKPQPLPLAHVKFYTRAQRLIDVCLSPFKKQIHRYRARKAHKAAVKAWMRIP